MQEEVRASRPEDFPDVERYANLHREGLLATPATIAERIVNLVASTPEPGGLYSVQ
jgi:benzil reductase ((S)-benzoin forming)